MSNTKQKKTKLKFVIVSTRQKYGGAIALHSLCMNLIELGYDARIFYTDYFVYDHKASYWMKWMKFKGKDAVKHLLSSLYPSGASKWNFMNGFVNTAVPENKVRVKHTPWVDDKTIVVYPDVTYGNPLHARNVVRWFLYYNRYDASAYGKNDLFYCFREVFNDKRFNPEQNTLFTTYFNLDFYKRTNYGERSGKCYIVRKGRDRNDLPKQFDGIVIDNLPEPEKVKVLNQSEYCISYDTQTAYSQIAALCGCISVVIPEEGKRKEDYRASEDNLYGIAFGFDKDELKYAKETQPLVYQLYLDKNRNGKNSTEKFAEKCLEYFKEKKA